MKIFLSFLLLFISIENSETISQKPDLKQEKIIEKQFSVNPDAVLDIQNQYGNINLSAWHKDEIHLEIKITAKGKNKNKVEERLKSISVEFTADQKKVSAKTLIKSGFFKRNNTNFSIDYFVKLPKTIYVQLQNKYGNLNIDELSGGTSIILDYGNLQIKYLDNKDNKLKLNYVSKAKINALNTAQIQAGYSNIEIDKAEDLILNSNYSNLNIKQIKNLKTESGYGEITIEEADQLDLKTKYTKVKIAFLTEQLISHNNYGSLILTKVKNGFKKISLTTAYTPVSIGIEAHTGYEIEAEITYGKLRFPSSLESYKMIEKNSESYYSGKAGNGYGKILLQMSYANPQIKLIH